MKHLVAHCAIVRLVIDWDQVYGNLQNLDDIESFAAYIRNWLQNKQL